MVTLLSDPDYCIMDKTDFRKQLAEGIPSELPAIKKYDSNINHAPKRKDILSPDEKRLAVKNALRYFPSKFHKILAREFAEELKNFGRIYMYRFRCIGLTSSCLASSSCWRGSVWPRDLCA